jgi:protein involved in polysaccharide export with SLBB domain
MPFIGVVRAAGLKAETLAVNLQDLYKKAEIYTMPTIQVIDNDGQKVNQQLDHVGGFVRRPGPVPYISNLTLWQAIQAAGGANEFGSMKRVKVTRQGQIKEYNVEKAEYQQIELLPGDGIDVPEKNILGG